MPNEASSAIKRSDTSVDEIVPVHMTLEHISSGMFIENPQILPEMHLWRLYWAVETWRVM